MPDHCRCRPALQRGILILSAFITSTLMPASADALEALNCTGRLDQILFKGASVTRESSLLAWSGLTKGQAIDLDTALQVRQKLLDKGLFRRVDVDIVDPCSDTAQLIVEVEEKHYHIVYPRLNRSGDGDVSRGVKYRASNLFGTDQTLSITVANKDYADGKSSESIRFDYDLPMVSTPYQLRWAAYDAINRLPDTTIPVEEQESAFSFSVGRDWNLPRLTMPVTVLARISTQHKKLSPADHQQPSVETRPGDYHTLGVTLEYDNIHNEYYRRFGSFYAISIDKGLKDLGSDFDAARIKLEARLFKRLNALDNFNARFIIATSSSSIFNEPTYEVGGAETIRGIAAETLRGNALWLANLEYVLGFARWPSLRTALFSDIGNLFREAEDIDRHQWQMTLGAGLRWKLTSFVDTDLVVDYAYDPDSGYSKVYAGTSLAF